MERTERPLSLSFNVAVETICSRLFPCGFDVVEEGAPDSLAALNERVASTGRMAVWGGASEHTIFACPEHNVMFRAWHDWAHWRGQHPFTVEGEEAVAAMQKANLRTIYGEDHPDMPLWDAILDAEVIEQAKLHSSTGEFPEDQVEFTRARVAAAGFAV